MAGLLDNYGTDPLNQGLLNLGVALMTPRAAGGGVANGLLAFNQGAMQAQQYRRALEQDARRNKLLDAQIANFASEDELRKMKVAQAKAELDRQERIRQRLGGMGGDTSSAAPAGPAVEMPTTIGFGGGFMAPGGPMPDTQAPSFGMGGAQPAAQRPTKLGAFNQYSNIAKIYESEGDLETATKYRDMAMKAMPEVKNIETVLVGGKPTMRLFFKDGTYEDVTDAAPKANVESVNFGGYRQNLNKDTGQYEGAQIPVTMDEAQRMSARQRQQEIGLSGARLGLERERFGWEKNQPSLFPMDSSAGPIVVDRRTGQAAPVTMNGAVVPPKPPEAARAQAQNIDAELSTIRSAMADVKRVPSAFSMERGVATMVGPITESARGRFDSPDERKTRAFVFNVVSKSINERAGAAQSAQELARLRSFLPAETDDAQQVQDKLTGYEQYLLERRKGYEMPGIPAAPAGNSPAGSPGGFDFREAARAELERRQRGGK